MRSATPSGQTNQSRRLDLHQHGAVYKTAAFLNRATSAIQAGVQGFEPCRAALEAASSPRRTLLYRPRPCDRGHRRANYSFSVTFQYASLMNFDQLSIRMLWSAYSGFQAGRTGFFRIRILACSGVRSAFRLLHSSSSR